MPHQKRRSPSLTREMAAATSALTAFASTLLRREKSIPSILSPGTEKIVETIPLRRLGQPSEVADTIYYLCTEASSYVSGAEIHINGGQHV